MIFTKRPTLTKEDKRIVALANLQELQSRIGEKIWETGSGLVTQSCLASKVQHEIETTSKKLSFDDLARMFDVSLEAIRSVPMQFYQEQSLIYGPKVLAALEAMVPNEPLLVIEFCKKEAVTFKLVQHLARHGNLTLVGDYLLTNDAAATARDQLEAQLKSETPIVLEDSVLLGALLNQMTVDGRVDRTTREYVPSAYRAKQRNDLHEKLLKEGTLSSQQLHGFDLVKFAKRFDLAHTKDKVFSQQYIIDRSAEIKEKVDSNGFCDVSDVEIKPLLSLKFSEPVAGIYLKPAYENRIKTELAQWAADQGIAQGEQQQVTSTSNSRKLANQLQPPTSAQIQQHLDQQFEELPPRLLAWLVQKHTVGTRDAYLKAAMTVLDERIAKAATIVTARIAAYLNGVLECSGPLQQQLFEEWQAYASESDPAAGIVSSVAQAKDYFTVDSSLVTDSVNQLVTTNTQKLQKAQDAPSVLHLAVAIYYSVAIANKKAALKCRGKHLPKILKEFEFPACFTELKTLVIKKGPAAEVIAEVKRKVNEL